ncbi:RcnB family protein [Novosphingobium profundi]|uniref:RcnB family protein n=1 Tax=Novosphingobium profundi TaxID=1774954 RepID=UPI001BDA3D42|nr:RcnB family protein [Novosphingobium profundi]MBT0667416.1 RcnB family protein [Novosphingobium profundi]
MPNSKMSVAWLAAAVTLAGLTTPVPSFAQSHPGPPSSGHGDQAPGPSHHDEGYPDHAGGANGEKSGHSDGGHGPLPPSSGSHGGYPEGAPHSHRPPPFADRGRAGWWHEDPRFTGYRGRRPGFYFAPGYGYYRVPAGFASGAFVAGVVLPVAMRSYVVAEPSVYGLRAAPYGYGWFYAGDSFVLASLTTGVVLQAIAGGW